jgi:hypothetical protein
VVPALNGERLGFLRRLDGFQSLEAGQQLADMDKAGFFVFAHALPPSGFRSFIPSYLQMKL